MFILILQTKIMFMSHCKKNWEIKHFVKCQSVVVLVSVGFVKLLLGVHSFVYPVQGLFCLISYAE